MSNAKSRAISGDDPVVAALRGTATARVERARVVRGAHPERSIEQAIEHEGVIRPADRVLIACSGGPDSVALVGALHALVASMRLDLQIAHVNHGVRGAARQDECAVMSVAARHGLPLAIARVTAEKRDEASLRDARYAALLEIARRCDRTVVATAHHAQDQSETVLLALFRGTGSAGLRGMRARRPLAPGIDLARPLLTIGPEALRRSCHVRALPYAVDASNADPSVRRNAVREALEALRPLFPGIDAAVTRAAGLADEEEAPSRRADLRRRVRARLAREQQLGDVDFLHVESVVRTLESGGSGSFHMKAGVRLEILRGEIAGITRT